MKNVISVLVGLAVIFVGFFIIDPIIVDALCDMFNCTDGLFEFIIWIVVLSCTSGIILLIAAAVGVVTLTATDSWDE
jgi:hypothetical protein